MLKKYYRKVMLVEDDPKSVQALEPFLAKYCSETLLAQDGEQAWLLYLRTKPDLLITDIQLPKLDGIELIKRIRKQDQKIPIFIVTYYSYQGYLMEAVRLKLEDYILKPLTSTKLHDLAEHLKQRLEESNNCYFIDEQTAYYFHSKKVLHLTDTIDLTHLEIEFLEFVIHHRGEVVTYEELDWRLYQGVGGSKNALKIIASHLRKKIPTIKLEAIPSVGYQLL